MKASEGETAHVEEFFPRGGRVSRRRQATDTLGAR